MFVEASASERLFPPTILEKCASNSRIMNEPVIGPILVLQEYETSEDLCKYINDRKLKGSMAQYFFGPENSDTAKMLMQKTSTGAFIMNDTFMPF